MKQHIIPRFLIQNFCDAHGQIWVGDTETGSLYISTPKKEFSINHLYDNREDISKRGVKYERELGAVERVSAPVVNHVLREIRSRRIPSLTTEQETVLKRFIYSIAVRTPESQKRLLSTPEFEQTFRKVHEELGGRDDVGSALNEAKREFESGRFVHSEFAILEDSRAARQADAFAHSSDLSFLFIREREEHFVLGSQGISFLVTPNDEKQGFIPLASDVCVMACESPCNELLLEVIGRGNTLIRELNLSTATQSKKIVGCSQGLVRSLMEGSTLEQWT